MYGHAGVQFYTQPKTVRACPMLPAIQSHLTMRHLCLPCITLYSELDSQLTKNWLQLSVSHASLCLVHATCAMGTPACSGSLAVHGPDLFNRCQAVGVRKASWRCDAGDNELEGPGRSCREPGKWSGRGGRHGCQFWRSDEGPMSMNAESLAPTWCTSQHAQSGFTR